MLVAGAVFGTASWNCCLAPCASVVRARPVPRSVGEVTPSYLIDVLREAKVIAPFIRLRDSGGNAGGRIYDQKGLISEVCFIELTYSAEAPDAPCTLVLKLPSAVGFEMKVLCE